MLLVAAELFQLKEACINTGFLKENVGYLVWICRDPISLILGARFSLTLGI